MGGQGKGGSKSSGSAGPDSKRRRIDEAGAATAGKKSGIGKPEPKISHKAKPGKPANKGATPGKPGPKPKPGNKAAPAGKPGPKPASSGSKPGPKPGSKVGNKNNSNNNTTNPKKTPNKPGSGSGSGSGTSHHKAVPKGKGKVGSKAGAGVTKGPKTAGKHIVSIKPDGSPRRGRPPKNASSPISGPVSIHQFLVKRGPGRPSKQALADAAVAAAAAGVTLLDMSPAAKNKGCGRPRGRPPNDKSKAVCKVSSPMPKKVGKKGKQQPEPEKLRRPVGRPRLTDEEKLARAKISAKVKAEAAKVRRNRPGSSSSSDDDSSTDDDESDYSSRSHSPMPLPRVLTPPVTTHVFKLAEPAPLPPTTPIDFAAAPQVTGNPRPRQLEALVQQSEAAAAAQAAQAALAVAVAAEAAENAAAAAAAGRGDKARTAAPAVGGGESGIDEDDAIMNRPVRSTAVYDKAKAPQWEAWHKGKGPATAASLRAPVTTHRKKGHGNHDDATMTASAMSAASSAAAAGAGKNPAPAPHRRTKGPRPERPPERVSIRRQLLATEAAALASITTPTVAYSVERSLHTSEMSERSAFSRRQSQLSLDASVNSPGPLNASTSGNDFYDQVFSTEPISAMTVPDGVVLENGLLITERWKSEWNRPLQLLSKNIQQVNHPEFTVLTDSQTTQWSAFARPEAMIGSRVLTELERDAAILYTLDHHDTNWLQRYTTRCPRNPLVASDMERIMDRLEKDSNYTLNASRITMVDEELPQIKRDPAVYHRFGNIFTALDAASKAAYADARAAATDQVFVHADGTAKRNHPHAQPKVPLMGIPNPTYVSSYLPIPGADARKQLSIEGLPVNMTNEEQLRASVSIAGIVNRLGVGKIQALATLNYWVQKRSLRNWRSLLRSYYHPSPREWLVSKTPTLKHKFKVANQLRQKFEKLRLLTDLTRKRAEMQATLVRNREDAFLAQYNLANAVERAPIEAQLPITCFADLEALIAEQEAAQAAALMPHEFSDDASPFASDGVPEMEGNQGTSFAQSFGLGAAGALLEGRGRMGIPGAGEHGGEAGDAGVGQPAGGTGTFLDKIAGLWRWPGGGGTGSSSTLSHSDHIAGMTQGIGATS